MKRGWKRATTWGEFFEANPSLKQEAVASELGIGQSALSLIVNGKRMPRPELALAIEELTGVTFESMARARTEVA